MLTFWPKAPRLTCLSWWWLESRDWWSTRRLKGVEPLQEASSMVMFELTGVLFVCLFEVCE